MFFRLNSSAYFGYYLWQYGFVANHLSWTSLVSALMVHEFVPLCINSLYLLVFGASFERKSNLLGFGSVVMLGGIFGFLSHALGARGAARAIPVMGFDGLISIFIGLWMSGVYHWQQNPRFAITRLFQSHFFWVGGIIFWLIWQLLHSSFVVWSCEKSGLAWISHGVWIVFGYYLGLSFLQSPASDQ